MKEILLTSSALILALLALRRLFRRTLSRRVQYALWGLVLLRLLVPVSLPAADFSLLTAAEPVVRNTEALYVYCDRESTRGQNGAPVMGPPDAPFFAVGPATEDNSYTFQSRDALGSPVVVKADYQRQFQLKDILPPVWYGGIAAMACWLVLSNLTFWLRLRKHRKPYAAEGSRLPVYLVESGLPSPCLFGLFRPAVYLTPAAVASPESLRHVLAHEETHARHLDPLWSLLRGVCLTVYWFNPLVWWAALASRTDCELACDEGALRRLGEAERIPYGRTLLSLVPVRKAPANPLLSATTMTAGKRQLKDRIARVAGDGKALGAALFAAVALAALACAVTFTGAKTAETARPLTEKELAYFNGEFFTEVYTQGENMRRQFLTCIYDRPEDIDIASLVYNGTGLPEKITEADLAFVSENYINGVESDFVKISLANADAFMLENTGVSSQDAAWGGVAFFRWNQETEAFYNIYLDGEAAAYYRYTDALRDLEPVVFTSGQREGGTVRLYYQGSIFSEGNGIVNLRSAHPLSSGPLCLTLRERPGGGWWFVSNQWDGAALSRPDREPLMTIPLDGLEPYKPQAAEALPFSDGYREMLNGLEDPEHVLGDYGLMFFQSGDEIFAGVQNKLLSSWPQPFWSFRPGETGTYSASLFRNLMGHDGFCISYDPDESDLTRPRLNDFYYLDENGWPVLLARVEGWPGLIDLDGDGVRELVTQSSYAGDLYFRRDGKYYYADLEALLKDCWPQETIFSFDGWDSGSRCLMFQARTPLDTGVTAGGNVDNRTLYFDGENLLVYDGQRQPEDHMPEWSDVDSQLKEDAAALVENVLQTAGTSYDDWRITGINDAGISFFGGEEVRLCHAWQVQYELHTETLVESAENLWVSAGPGYLYYEETSGSGVFLYSEAKNEWEPGSSRFWAAMEERLYLMSVPLTELSGEELFHRLRTFEWTRRLMDDVGALPSRDRDAVLDTLASELNARGEASWRIARHFLRDTEDLLTPQGRQAWTALQARIVTPPAPEAAQAALDEIMAGNWVNLTLLGFKGGGRYNAAPHAGNGPNRAYYFTQSYNWTYAEAPGDVSAASLLVISQGGDVSFHFWPDSDLVLLSRSNEDAVWFRAVSNDGPGDPFTAGIFDFMRYWYDEAEYAGLTGNSVIPDRGQSHLEIAREWVDRVVQANLNATPGSKYAHTYGRAVVSLKDMPEEVYPDWTAGMERFYFSYEEIFVLENEKAATLSWNWAGNTTKYEGDDAPEGTLSRWQIGFMYKTEDGWHCDGTGTGP